MTPMRWPGSERKWMSGLACTLWHCQLLIQLGSITVGVKLDNEAATAADCLVWCIAFCVICPAFASQFEQKKPSSAPPMCHTLQTWTSSGWFTQDKIQSKKIELSICTNMCSTMAPHLANGSANGKKKSQSHVDPGMCHMCLQLGIRGTPGSHADGG